MSLPKKQRQKKIKSIKDKQIDYSDIPKLDDKFWENAVIKYSEKKKPITLRLDADILEWFKSMGKGYQTRINAILRTFYESHKRNVP